MLIGLHDADINTGFPNLSLMKLSAYHKSKGDKVEFFSPLQKYDKVYSSKIFTYTGENQFLPKNTIKGGTGYRLLDVTLPDEIEHICPDYSLYNIDYSMGFLTRGCPNNCSFCIVHDKEGNIRANADLEEFTRHKKVVLLDNNVLSCDHGLNQIDKIIKLGLKVDFNQALDPRLIDESIAKKLAQVKWLVPLRLAFNSMNEKKAIFKAVTLLRWNNIVPSRMSCLLMFREDIGEILERVKYLKTLYIDPFCQPFRDYNTNNIITPEQKLFRQWVNTKNLFKSISFEDFLDEGKRKQNEERTKFRRERTRKEGRIEKDS
jgi:hypothetical protein